MAIGWNPPIELRYCWLNAKTVYMTAGDIVGTFKMAESLGPTYETAIQAQGRPGRRSDINTFTFVSEIACFTPLRFKVPKIPYSMPVFAANIASSYYSKTKPDLKMVKGSHLGIQSACTSIVEGKITIN
jgi:hypothetical protein